MRASLERIARAGWPVLVGVVLGLAAGGIWTLAQPDRYRAEARVLVRGTARGLVPAVKALAESSLLEQNIAQTLRLSHPPRVSATVGEGGILTLSAEAGSRDRARQLDSEAAIVLARLVIARFGPSVETTVLDPAHPVEQTSPTPGRNLLIAGVMGLAAGVAAALALGRRRPDLLLERVQDPDVERRLQARIDAVAKRERAVARRAGEVAQRELDVGERERRLVEDERAAAIADVAPEPEREPEPQREPEPVEVPTTRPGGRWNLDELEHLVDTRSDIPPERIDEWRTYLFLLREHSHADGTLPAGFDALLNEVFAEFAAFRTSAPD